MSAQEITDDDDEAESDAFLLAVLAVLISLVSLFLSVYALTGRALLALMIVVTCIFWFVCVILAARQISDMARSKERKNDNGQ